MSAHVDAARCLNPPLFLQHLWHRRLPPPSKHPHLLRVLLPQPLALQPSLLSSRPPLRLLKRLALHLSSRRISSLSTFSLFAQTMRRGCQRAFHNLVIPIPETYLFPPGRDLFGLCFRGSIIHGALLELRVVVCSNSGQFRFGAL